MSRLPDILYLVHRVPFPPNRGDRIRSFHLLDFLSQRANIHLATLADEPVPAATVDALRQRCRAVEISPLGKTRWLSGATSLAGGRSATEGLFHSTRLRNTVRQWGREIRFDAAVVFCSSMLQYLDAPELREVPALVDLVDVDSQKWLDYADSAWGLSRRLFQWEGRRLRQLERKACQRAAAIMLVSESEADLFRSVCPNDSTHGVINGVDLDYFQPATAKGRPNRCVFVGALDYRANVDGVCWFAQQVWPRIVERCAQATFAIVGRNPVAEVRRLERVPGVEVVGSVADVRPHLADASLAIAPLRIARGIQNKVLEAMACSRAVIASPEALEGLQVQPGVHVACAETPDQWAELALALFADDQRRERLAEQGRSYVLRNHQWAKCLEPVEALLSKCMAASGSCRRATGGSDCQPALRSA
jgi:sugar transferase (PEP-CTERM/EpsH1 system associated)